MYIHPQLETTCPLEIGHFALISIPQTFFLTQYLKIVSQGYKDSFFMSLYRFIFYELIQKTNA